MPPSSGRSLIYLSSTDYDLPETPPQGLAKYNNFREMARGAVSHLRSCHDTITGRTVAVKALLPEFVADDSENQRLLREARVTAQLQHPNTVPVYEIGRDIKEGIYFTMKRISGENFFEILKKVARKDEVTCREFTVARRLEVVSDAALALAYAHARGVIHRDVKPENIWVGNFGEVILLDWGVAKVWGHPDPKPSKVEDDTQKLTKMGQRPGTPLYMSPEQVCGRTVDDRSDIFSTGVVLYEMLAFNEPFRGRNVEETFNNIQFDQVPPPSEKAPQRNIPAQLDAIVMKAIAKKPEERYASMLELVADLQAAIRSINQDLI